MATYSEKNPDEGETEIVCPECDASSVFDNERVRAWRADPDTDEEFDHPQADANKAFPSHEPCGVTMVPRDELN